MPRLGESWSIRLVEPDSLDVDLVHRWMNEAHVARFWKQAWSRADWAAEIVRQGAGEHSRPCIVDFDGAPLAYVEIYRVGRDIVAPHYPGLPHDLGIHLAIGDASRTGQGLGTATVNAVVAGLFAADARCRRVVGDPEASHVVARKVFEATGFVLHREVDLPHKRAALYVRPRAERDWPGSFGPLDKG